MIARAARPVAVITGATAGIGLEFARQLAARGHDLLLVARDAARLAAVAVELRDSARVDATSLPCDLAQPDGIQRLVEWLSTNACAVFVHSAGFGTKGALHLTDGAAQDAMLTLHVTATDRLMRAALPGMIARRDGALVVVSSVSAFTISAYNVNYSATKAYQKSYVESLSLELEGTGVQAQALCPGFTRTEFHARAHMKMGSIPAWAWLDVKDVVRASLAALDQRGPVVVVPKFRWRVIVWLLRHLPRGLMRGAATRYRSTRA